MKWSVDWAIKETRNEEIVEMMMNHAPPIYMSILDIMIYNKVSFDKFTNFLVIFKANDVKNDKIKKLLLSIPFLYKLAIF